MSIEIINTVIESTGKTVVERTWRGEQFTEFQSLDPAQINLTRYRAIVHRERVTVVDNDGIPPSISRKPIPLFVGEPAEGTDGSDPSHYQDAKIGFNPRIATNMDEVLKYDDSETVTVGGVTVPAKIVPLLLQATYDLVAQRHQQADLAAAIQAKVDAVLESQG